MHVSIRRYQLDPASIDEVTRVINESFIPIISQGPGFIAYYVLDGGDGVVATVSVFEDLAGAEESNRMAADWIRQDAASLFPTPPEITAGEVKVHKAK